MVDFPYLFLLPPSSSPRIHPTPILYTQTPASIYNCHGFHLLPSISHRPQQPHLLRRQRAGLVALAGSQSHCRLFGRIGARYDSIYAHVVFSTTPSRCDSRELGGDLVKHLHSRTTRDDLQLEHSPHEPLCPHYCDPRFVLPLYAALQIKDSSSDRSTKHLYTLTLLLRIVRFRDHFQLRDLVQLLDYSVSIILVLYPSSKWIALEPEFVSSRVHDNHQVGDASGDESFGTLDISPTHASESNVPKTHPLRPCRNSAISTTKPSRPRKTLSSNSVKQQVAPISSGNSLDCSSIERSLIKYTPLPTIPAEGPECLVQPANTIEPPARVEPRSRTEATEAIRIDTRSFQRFWDSDKCESSPSLTRTPSSYDRSSSRVLPPISHSKTRLRFIRQRHRHRPCWSFTQRVAQPGTHRYPERSGFKGRQ